MELSFMYFKGLKVKDVFMSLKIVILVNSADPDEMPPYSSESSLFAKVPVYRY